MPKLKNPVNQETSKNQTKPKLHVSFNKKKILTVLLFVVVLLVVGLASYTISRNKALAANRPAEKALVALKANDSKSVYNLGTDEFKKASNEKQVKSVVEQWSKIINQATTGEPELTSKKESTKDGKELTTLVYKYGVKPDKTKVNQKELFVKVVTQKVEKDYKLYTFTIDSK